MIANIIFFKKRRVDNDDDDPDILGILIYYYNNNNYGMFRISPTLELYHVYLYACALYTLYLLIDYR